MYVSKPNLGSVCKDRDEDSVEDVVPGDKLQASDRVSEDAEGMNEATDSVGHGLHMQGPVELGREKHAQVSDGLGDGDPVGRVGGGGEEDGRGGYAKETRGVTGRVEKHKLGFIKVNGEAHEGEPSVDLVPGSRDLGNHGKEGGARSIDVTIINIEREVDIVPLIRGVEEWGGGEGGEDRGEGGALWGALVDVKRV